MRVIAGKLRGRNLKTGEKFRPTTDRVRETLFNILQNDIPDSVFVDVFAGSGSVGIEAISRGAAIVYFIETNRKALHILEQNLEACCTGESWRILTMDVWKALQVLPRQLPHVDFFFYDPPYDFSEYSNLLAETSRLFGDATLIVEHSARTKVNEPEGLVQTRSTRIGETQISFFRKKCGENLLQEGK
jgi:16S rRNA (guanine966-N2)-methyltransferase